MTDISAAALALLVGLSDSRFPSCRRGTINKCGIPKGVVMTVVIRFTRGEEAKALPLLLRHSRGMVLPDRTYVLDQGAVEALRSAGVRFIEVSRNGNPSGAAGAIAGERI
jgi:hypothetical protein